MNENKKKKKQMIKIKKNEMMKRDEFENKICF